MNERAVALDAPADRRLGCLPENRVGILQAAQLLAIQIQGDIVLIDRGDEMMPNGVTGRRNRIGFGRDDDPLVALVVLQSRSDAAEDRSLAGKTRVVVADDAEGVLAGFAIVVVKDAIEERTRQRFLHTRQDLEPCFQRNRGVFVGAQIESTAHRYRADPAIPAAKTDRGGKLHGGI